MEERILIFVRFGKGDGGGIEGGGGDRLGLEGNDDIFDMESIR